MIDWVPLLKYFERDHYIKLNNEDFDDNGLHDREEEDLGLGDDSASIELKEKIPTKMLVRLHARNTLSFLMIAFFVYLGYIIFFESGDGFPEIDIDLKDIASYAVLAVEMGGLAVQRVHDEQVLHIAQKGLTDEGKAELLTKADLVSNYLILDVLQRFPKLKIISEEKDSTVTEKEADGYRSDSYSLWLSVKDVLNRIPNRRIALSDVQVYVDPLDATQEFTEGLVQYVTVMVCVVVKDEPVFGAIYRPFFNETIFGVKDFGVMSSSGHRIDPPQTDKIAKTIVVSRSHAGAVQELAKKSFGDGYTVEPAGGSGYKTLRLVNGTAEMYIHQTAIKKWDTCAGDAVLRALGGAMLDLDGAPLKYGVGSPIVNKRGLLASVRTPYSYYKKMKPNVKLNN